MNHFVTFTKKNTGIFNQTHVVGHVAKPGRVNNLPAGTIDSDDSNMGIHGRIRKLFKMWPQEMLENILILLSPKQRFQVATDFRFIFLQRRHCLPWLEYANCNRASLKGQCDLLDAWKTSGLPLVYSARSMDHNHTRVLEWWKTSGLKLKYYDSALEHASTYGWIHVLEWWKTSGLDIHYSKNAVQMASAYGNTAVLEWWKNNWPELDYTESAMELASLFGRFEVLEWWKNSGLPLKYYAGWWDLDVATHTIKSHREKCACIDEGFCARVSDWWKNNINEGGTVRNDRVSFDIAIRGMFTGYKLHTYCNVHGAGADCNISAQGLEFMTASFLVS